MAPDVLWIANVAEGVLGNPAMLSSDGMHPNAEGYARLAETVWRHLRSWQEAAPADRADIR